MEWDAIDQLTVLQVATLNQFIPKEHMRTTMNTALLLIDIQNDYFPGGTMELADPDQAAGNARLLLQKFRKEKMPIVHIRHIATKPTATFFLPGTPGSEIHASVQPETDEKIIIKHFPNSFRETELLEYLKSNNISTLVICGMMTHMCVDATVRAAKDFGFNCTVIGDACATRELEIHGERVRARDVHNAFLSALNGTYAEVKTAAEYLKG
jgi:nicotinamidase-related amidase